MNTRSNGPSSDVPIAGSPAAAANASSAGRLITWICSSGIPAWRHQPRARLVRDSSGSRVTIVPPAGCASAIHSVE